MKGILLAGGKATRLYPITRAVCKQLLPVYDKPMIYYPLSTLLLAGIKDILIISTPDSLSCFKNLLGDGSNFGIRLTFAVQKRPGGIAESFLIGKDFIGNDTVCLILGDNIFYGPGLSDILTSAARLKNGATVFGYYVRDPERYGVIEFDKRCRVTAIKEKPKKPKTKFVVTGMYFYDNEVVRIAESLKPSARGELEITDVNNAYLKKKKLRVKLLGRGYAWLDMGTYDSLIEASIFIKTIEERQELKIGCLEETAFRLGLISAQQLRKLAHTMPTSYGNYLREVVNK
ncbi:MAG: glucose-1-phosphate thymidylyltransferase RfbA [Candidatus Omnitrophica bacterium]|nr:glucose-1-phosphate thymidylyltransferase RfbA [Candidatus Omnitrophota bacterium]